MDETGACYLRVARRTGSRRAVSSSATLQEWRRLWSRRRGRRDQIKPNSSTAHADGNMEETRTAKVCLLREAKNYQLGPRAQSRFSFFVLSLCVGGGGKETRLGGRATHLGKKHRNNSTRYLSQQLCSDFLSVTMSFSWKAGCESGKLIQSSESRVTHLRRAFKARFSFTQSN